MEQKLSKWYAVPPYKIGENWKILNDKGEIVAWFEDREDCEKAVEVYNRATWWTPAPEDDENKENRNNG